MKISTVQKKGTTIITTSVTNWLAQDRSAVNVSTVLTAIIGRPTPAGNITQSASTMVVDEKPAPNVAQSPTTLVVDERAALNVNPVATLLMGEVAAGNIAQGASTLVVDQKPSPNLSAAPSVFTILEKPAPNITGFYPVTLLTSEVASPNLSTGRTTLVMDEKPTGKIVQVEFDLAYADFVVTAAQDAGGTGTWNNPTRMQGANDETGDHSHEADFAGGLILLTGTLRGTMVTQPTTRPLVIDRVDLDWYGEANGLPLVSDLVSSLALGFRINTSPVAGVDKDMISITTGATNNFVGTPKTARIDDGAGKFLDGATPTLSTAVTWANISLIQPYFKASIIANLLAAHYYADAIKIRVTAHLTWNPAT